MKIAALVDLTDICKKAVEFAGVVAKKSNAQLVLVHVADQNSPTETIEAGLKNLATYVAGGVEVENHVVKGDFFSLIPTILHDLEVEMAVVPTHGKVGLMQNLFGANILKLVNTLPIPSIVVQESSMVSQDVFKNILFPVGPHSNFEIKIEQTAAFAKIFESNVVIYTVRNDVRGISEKLRDNIEASKKHFVDCGIPHEVVNEEPSGFSVGYAKHILSYAEDNSMNAISIMAKISEDNGYLGKTDKENVLLNEQKLPVFCCNQFRLV